MPISSLIIRTDQTKTDMVRDVINQMGFVESTEVFNENIVVITETKTQREDKELFETLKEVKGVLQCDLVYHNFEDQKG